MRVHLDPATDNFNAYEKQKWKNVLLNASLELVKISVMHSQRAARETKQKEQNILVTGLVSAAELVELGLYEGKRRGEINVTKRRKLSRDGIWPQRSAPSGTAQMTFTVCQARDVGVASGQAEGGTPERLELFNASINDKQQKSCSLREPMFRSPDTSHVPQLATPETGVGAGPVVGPAPQDRKSVV